MIRTFLLASLLLCSAALPAARIEAAASPARDSRDNVIPLDGEWRFDLDRKDAGVAEGWFNRELSKTIRLPGAISTRGLGDPISAIRQQIWGGDYTDQPLWHPMIRSDYRGNAWYQTTVEVPAAWAGRPVELFLERVCWVSEAWIDGRSAGVIDTLSAPHRHVLGPLTPGRHRIALRIDNRPLHDLGCNTHAYHEQACTIYNGVIGRMELRAIPLVSVTSNQIFPDAASGVCEMRLTLANATGKPQEVRISARVGAAGGSEMLAEEARAVTLPPGETKLSVPVKLPPGAVKRWSEFERPLYQAEVRLAGAAGVAVREDRFGFRVFKGEGTRFTINGRPVLLRGEANVAQFPLTGHPPMDKAAWLKIFGLMKSFGLNHFRCHSWVPPEAAFEAADELGLYVLAELPNGEASVATDSEAGLRWRLAEFDRILETYGNHPSFVLFCGGNEAKTPKIDFLKSLVVRGKANDPRRLYATIANPEASGILDEVPGDDFAVAHGSAGGRRRLEPFVNREPPETLGDYRATMAGRPVPQISHETGQWYVHPDLSEIEKYTGALRPVALEHFREVARREGVLAQMPAFVDASGRLSLELYKEEIERSLRTQEYGGFQLLGLQDSFNQGSAYVGMVNGFLEPKPFVTAERFREFCGPQVPLARMAKRTWTSDETFVADIEFANYGPAPIRNANLDWRVMDGSVALASGTLSARSIPDTGLVSIGKVTLPLSGISKARALQLEVSLRDSTVRNRWNVWVYPTAMPADPAGVLVVKTLDAAAQQALREGRLVVLLPAGFNSPYPTAMTPPFWSPIMFPNQKQTLGLLCDPAHPALADFPTAGHSDWQWFDLLFQASAIRLHGTPETYRPIVQAIDRPDRAHKLALVYETRVGPGKLLVCTLDLHRDLDKRPVARQLRRSLLAYAAGPAFNPTTEISLDENLPAFTRESVLARLAPKMSASTEHENFWAMNAADNNPETCWHSNWNPPEPALPHALVIELKQPVTVKGFIQTPRKDCDHGRIARYRIHAGDDGKNWKTVAEGDWPNNDQSQKVMLEKPVTARFFKLESLKEVQNRPWTSVAEFDVVRENIPFPNALDAAAVQQDRLDEIHRRALPLGNGDLNALLCDRDGVPCLRLTKNDIWDARIDTSKDAPLLRMDVRNRSWSGGAGQVPSWSDHPYPQPRCAAVVRIGSPEQKEPVTRAHLDLRRAVARANDAMVRILADRNVVVIDGGRPVSLEEVKSNELPPAQSGETEGVKWLHMKMPGDLDYPGMEYAIAVVTNGTRQAVGVATSFETQGPVLDAAVKLAREGFAEDAVARHEAVWAKFWSASGLELGDQFFQDAWYRNLYYMRCFASAESPLPIMLFAGLSKDETPWHGAPTLDYNFQQTFWPMFVCNHVELADPYVRFLKDFAPRGRWLARQTYGVDGLFLPVNIFGPEHLVAPETAKSKNSRQICYVPWSYALGCTGWALQNVWWRHAYAPDANYLESVYPLLRDGAEFYANILEQCLDGEIGPSYNPEHGPFGTFNNPVDIAYFRFLLATAAEAAGQLKRDAPLAERWKRQLTRVPAYETTTFEGKSIIANWKDATADSVPEHNVVVPTVPIFPAEQVTWFSPDGEKQLFERTLRWVKFHDFNSHIMVNVQRARLSMPEAYTRSREHFTKLLTPNGLFAEWPGHGSYLAESWAFSGMTAELLMQSVGGIVRVFPAWPKEHDAKFTDLRAEGGFLISAEQTSGKITKLEVTSTVGGRLRLLDPWTGKVVERDSKPGERLVFRMVEER